MKFFQVDKLGPIYGAMAAINGSGGAKVQLGFRIDARTGRYRCDVRKPLFPAWEAIDGGKGFATLAQAKKFVKRWVKAVEEQETLTPRMEES